MATLGYISWVKFCEYVIYRSMDSSQTQVGEK